MKIDIEKDLELVTIQFEPDGIRTSVPLGTTVLEAARAAGVSIPAFCGGHSSCGKCRIRLIDNQNSVSDVTSEERKSLSAAELKGGIRLACQVKVLEDTKVFCLDNAPAEDNVILTSMDSDLSESSSCKINSDSCKKLHLGAAIDIGTTTLAAYLYDLDTGTQLSSAARMNPQIPYGDDVISRISYCNEKPENTYYLQKLILNSLSELLQELCNKSDSDINNIYETVLVGNTVMTHILLGVSPECLGHAPFTPTVRKSQKLSAKDLNLPIHSDGKVYILPAADGFIGADHMAALLKADQKQYPGTTLVIDIGTNSEICLYSDGSYYCTSCATGPALEGAMIQCGMHAGAGAIDHVTIDPVTLKPNVHSIGDHICGICGSGIIDAAASMLSTGILDPDGSFSSHAVSEYIQINQNGEKEYILYKPDAESGNEKNKTVVITQQDIRNIQLAKAALYAGTKLLLEKNGGRDPDRILLAGAFGSYIDVRQALILGLFPDCAPATVTALGNAAGAGAVMALLDPSRREEADRLADEIIFLESANDPAFSRDYADAMILPHRRDSFVKSNPVIWNCPCNDRHLLPEDFFEKEGKELPVIEIEAPFTILAALVDPVILYKVARKEPDRLSCILEKIADAECTYIDKLLKAGAQVLSLADPLGSAALTGEKIYKTVILPSELHVMKKCKRHLKKGLIHLCGHMAADLIQAGGVIPHKVRLNPEITYIDNLFLLSSNTKIRFMGPGCIRTFRTGSVLGTVLDIS